VLPLCCGRKRRRGVKKNQNKNHSRRGEIVDRDFQLKVRRAPGSWQIKVSKPSAGKNVGRIGEQVYVNGGEPIPQQEQLQKKLGVCGGGDNLFFGEKGVASDVLSVSFQVGGP